MNSKEFTAKKWILIYITSIIMGIIAYLVVVKLIFNPDIVNVPIVAFKILQK